MSNTILPKDFDINKVTYEPFNSIKGTNGKNDKKQIFIIHSEIQKRLPQNRDLPAQLYKGVNSL